MCTGRCEGGARSMLAIAASSEWPRLFSIGSKYGTVLRRSILPAVWIAPPACSRASNNVVLPAAGWPASATLRMSSVLYGMSGLLPVGWKAVMAVRAARPGTWRWAGGHGGGRRMPDLKIPAGGQGGQADRDARTGRAGRADAQLTSMRLACRLVIKELRR